jgi:arsenate reductase-like glutaredoxin family protein
MILTKKVNIKLSNTNIKHYEHIFNKNNIGTTVEVHVADLNHKSTVGVECECDVCGKIKKIEYRYYIKNITPHNIYTCSPKCSKIKREKTNLEKYGVKYHSMLKDVFKEKVIKTSLERYGENFYMQTDEYKKRVKNTNIKKYGETTPLLNSVVRDKIDKTNLGRYGTKHPTQNQIIRKKIEKTNLERYGNCNPAKSDEIKCKTKKTNIEKYGFEWPNQNIDVYNKIKTSMFKTKKYKNLYYKSSYELDFINFCEKNKIEISNAPTIKYIVNERDKVYFPDFYIPKYNLIVEVKSAYTYDKELDLNLTKKEWSIRSGYDFIFIIDKNYDELIDIDK